MKKEVTPIFVRTTQKEDYKGIERLSRLVYPHDEPWTAKFLDVHLDLFPEGQLVAIDRESGDVAGMAASLIIAWDDYDRFDNYNEFTASGYFTNHDPSGRTLYGAEVMVDPSRRRQGIGSKLYEARRELVRRLGLLRIRAGARLAGYHKYQDELTPEAYVEQVIDGRLYDPTLTFQLHEGFEVLAVVHDYLHIDPRSAGYAALIEWINREAARPEDLARRKMAFPSSRVAGH